MFFTVNRIDISHFNIYKNSTHYLHLMKINLAIIFCITYNERITFDNISD